MEVALFDMTFPPAGWIVYKLYKKNSMKNKFLNNCSDVININYQYYGLC